MAAPFSFILPPELAAKEPPEQRGIPRDGVRLLVIDRASGRIEHTRFNALSHYLRRGDLLVFNTSRTLPASLVGCDAPPGPCIEVRLAEHFPDDTWLALLLCRDEELFACGLRGGLELRFEGGLTCRVLEPAADIPRLWRVRFSLSGAELVDALYRIGQPVRYNYVSAPWNIDYYQTVYAREPGSAEMPSAGRAFTWKLLFDLKRRGVNMAYIVLHTGLSSYMDDELDAQHPASEEEYVIGHTAADAINAARAAGGRVIAVGTTVVRALESAARAGIVQAAHGYTRLHIDGNHWLSVTDGLLTGLHEPAASHLDLLTAFLPPEQLQSAYNEAVQLGYLWHEFGDLNLIL
jgi:S-adenosylmethionine:tRNA ribosyltransferase-isomerase